ncbi:hypothetical protein [Streptomyces sp. NPDC047070]|uniref:hypothetical protein n=1 Tax=Streptomyces sp. NPDC047070 TaxID=3154923 RepID=UPI0034533B1F
MKISEVIADLLQLQAEHGDLEVQAYSYGDIEDGPVAEPLVRTPKKGPAYVLIEP